MDSRREWTWSKFGAFHGQQRCLRYNANRVRQGSKLRTDPIVSELVEPGTSLSPGSRAAEKTFAEYSGKLFPHKFFAGDSRMSTGWAAMCALQESVVCRGYLPCDYRVKGL